MNELILIIHSALTAIMAIISLKLGQQALTAFICLGALLANLFVTKQITLLGFNATASDAYIIGASLGLNLLQDYYGRSAARKAIWISFFIVGCYTLLSQIHILYSPSIYDISQSHFQAIFSIMPRLMGASATAYLIAELLNSRLFLLLTTRKRLSFTLRSFIATALSQVADTVIFSFLGLYGILSALTHVMIVSYTIKMLAICITLPLLVLIKKMSFLNQT